MIDVDHIREKLAAYKVAYVSAQCGVCQATVRRFIKRECEPSLDTLMRFDAFLSKE